MSRQMNTSRVSVSGDGQRSRNSGGEKTCWTPWITAGRPGISSIATRPFMRISARRNVPSAPATTTSVPARATADRAEATSFRCRRCASRAGRASAPSGMPSSRAARAIGSAPANTSSAWHSAPYDPAPTRSGRTAARVTMRRAREVGLAEHQTIGQSDLTPCLRDERSNVASPCSGSTTVSIVSGACVRATALSVISACRIGAGSARPDVSISTRSNKPPARARKSNSVSTRSLRTAQHRQPVVSARNVSSPDGDQVVVQADLAELVDDDGGASEGGIAQHARDQRGFAGTKEAGDDGDGGHRGLAFKGVSGPSKGRVIMADRSRGSLSLPASAWRSPVATDGLRGITASSPMRAEIACRAACRLAFFVMVRLGRDRQRFGPAVTVCRVPAPHQASSSPVKSMNAW